MIALMVLLLCIIVIRIDKDNIKEWKDIVLLAVLFCIGVFTLSVAFVAVILNRRTILKVDLNKNKACMDVKVNQDNSTVDSNIKKD